MQRDNAPQLAERAGAELRHLLLAVPGVVGVRGLGLLLGVQLDPRLDAKVVAADLLAAGLIVNPVTADTLRLAPPLIVGEDDLARAVDLLAGVLATRLAEVGA